MRTSPAAFGVLAAALLLAVGACERREEPRPAGQLSADTTAAGTAVMQTEPEMMRRHAVEADQMAAQMRPHINAMWQLPPREVPAHLDQHSAWVNELLTLIESQIREMDHGMGMDEAQMGEMMGIRADQYRLLREEMRTARAEVEALHAASESEIRERLRGHLDRLARIVDTLEASAAHMHRVAEQAAAP